jgi:hypothetical protein
MRLLIIAAFSILSSSSILTSSLAFAQPVPAANTNAPLDPISAFPAAQAARAGTAVRFWQAQSNLATFLRNQRIVFLTSTPYLEALAARDQATLELVSARQDVLARLQQDPAYIEAARLRDQLGNELAAARNAPVPDGTRIAALIEMRLQLASRITARQSDALSLDSRYATARQAHAAANSRLESLKIAFDVSLRTGAALAEQRQALHNAAHDRAAATAFAEGTARAANALLRYAYYTQELSLRRPQIVLAPYATNPYGGYSYPPAYPPTYPQGAGYGLMPGR